MASSFLRRAERSEDEGLSLASLGTTMRWLVVAAVAVTSGARSQGLTRTQAIADALSRSPRASILAADTASAFAGLLTARAVPNPTVSAVYSRDTPNYHLTADLPIDFFWLRNTKVEAAQL